MLTEIVNLIYDAHVILTKARIYVVPQIGRSPGRRGTTRAVLGRTVLAEPNRAAPGAVRGYGSWPDEILRHSVTGPKPCRKNPIADRPSMAAAAKEGTGKELEGRSAQGARIRRASRSDTPTRQGKWLRCRTHSHLGTAQRNSAGWVARPSCERGQGRQSCRELTGDAVQKSRGLHRHAIAQDTRIRGRNQSAENRIGKSNNLVLLNRCGLVAARQRRFQARGLIARRQQLEGGNQLHTVKYGVFLVRKQDCRAAARPAIPLPPKVGSLARRSG